MDSSVVILLCLLASASSLAFLLLELHRNRYARLGGDHSLSTYEDDEGNALAVDVPMHGLPREYTLAITAALLPLHRFGLGVMVGVGLCGIAAQAIIAAPGEAHVAVWLASWALVAALVQAAVFAAERIAVARCRDEGVFRVAVDSGASPVAAAAFAWAVMRRFRMQLYVTMFALGALIAGFHADGTLLGLCFACLALMLGWRARQVEEWPVRLDEAHRQLMPARLFMAEGGWVYSAGIMLSTAALCLLTLWRLEMGVMIVFLQAAIVLTIWSEQVSRARQTARRLPEWVEEFSRTLCQEPAGEPVRAA